MITNVTPVACRVCVFGFVSICVAVCCINYCFFKWTVVCFPADVGGPILCTELVKMTCVTWRLFVRWILDDACAFEHHIDSEHTTQIPAHRVFLHLRSSA